MNNNKNVLLIGSLPPPVGGVTIYLERFLKKNLNSGEFTFYILDCSKKKFIHNGESVSLFKGIKEILSKTEVIHLHVSNHPKLLIALFFKIIGKKVIYTHHNSRIDSTFIFSLLLKICDKVILVNSKNLKLKPKVYDSHKIYKIPAFIEPSGGKELPPYIINKINKSNFVASSYISNNNLINGKSIYGVDLLIDAFESAIRSYDMKDFLLILVDPNNSINDYVIRRIKHWEPCFIEKFLYVNHSIDFISLIKRSQLILRPTRTDGDSLTVREALFYSVPVIASDCSLRPAGTILHRNDDARDLEEKILSVYNGKIKLNYENTDFNEEIISVYRSLVY